MSDSPQTPEHPKPSVPKPNIPKPNIPTPTAAKTPAPNLTPRQPSPPVSKLESGALEKSPEPEPVAAEAAPEHPPVPETILHKRLIAAVIDGLLAGAISFLLQTVLPGQALDKIGFAVAVAYILLRDSLPFLGGQSIGKKAMAIRACTTEGSPLSNRLKTGVIRNILLIIPVMPLVELFILYSREDGPKRGLRLGDEFAGTMVRAEPLSAPAAAEVSEES